ncbi:hypothetical protein GA0070624_4430 [Micromonospora rhizosphaerae]|uniref:Uncharacterized protein n=1 Tax=Micromonospora rhizosphaerae TaxID=568872 RepID=A0A1C6SSB4_9ACTN|nr:hypothetical protein [Micromonospora rhizosphaerae]SCL32259.1 hypothetical protein GA0070624_4430 [Micromonospora rhizosphaerae]
MIEEHEAFAGQWLGALRDHAGAAVVAFDREFSGWGAPAADVHLIISDPTREALRSYRSAVSEYTHALDDRMA